VVPLEQLEDAKALRRQGSFSDAIDLLDRILESLPSEARSERVECLNELSRCYTSTGDLKTAEVKAEEALELAEESSDDTTGQGRALYNLGRLFWKKGELNTAKEFYERSYLLWEQVKDKKWIARLLNGFGAIYLDQGKLSKAEEHLQKALEYDYTSVPAHSILGEIYYDRADYEEAAFHFRRVQEFEPEDENVLSRLSDVYTKLGDKEKSRELYLKSLGFNE